MIALIGVGAGGNLPVDGTMFLEFIPGNKQYLLTFLSVWWALGQVVASLIAVRSFFRSHKRTPADISVGLYCQLRL
jgi:MFS family permease